MKFYYYLFLFLLGCENPLINNDNKNCIIELGGFYDDCNVCSGGVTGHIPNSDKDCNDVCFGSFTLDGCGVCDDNFDNDIKGTNLPIIVDFWAEWCGPCKHIEPVLEELSKENKDKVKILKLNISC